MQYRDLLDVVETSFSQRVSARVELELRSNARRYCPDSYVSFEQFWGAIAARAGEVAGAAAESEREAILARIMAAKKERQGMKAPRRGRVQP